MKEGIEEKLDRLQTQIAGIQQRLDKISDIQRQLDEIMGMHYSRTRSICGNCSKFAQQDSCSGCCSEMKELFSQMGFESDHIPDDALNRVVGEVFAWETCCFFVPKESTPTLPRQDKAEC